VPVSAFRVRRKENTTMPNTPLFRPGEPSPLSGQFEIVGPRGGATGEERTAVRGKPLPPTPEPGQRYRPVDPTNNGAGRPRR
jgi:hypothetical protein